MLVAASSLAVLPLQAFAVSLVAFVRLGRGGDRNAPWKGCNPRCYSPSASFVEPHRFYPLPSLSRPPGLPRSRLLCLSK